MVKKKILASRNNKDHFIYLNISHKQHLWRTIKTSIARHINGLNNAQNRNNIQKMAAH